MHYDRLVLHPTPKFLFKSFLKLYGDTMVFVLSNALPIVIDRLLKRKIKK